MSSAIVTPKKVTCNVLCVVSGLALLTAGCATKKAELLEPRPVVPSPFSEPAAVAPVAPPVAAEPAVPEAPVPTAVPVTAPAAAPAAAAPAAKPSKVGSKIVEHKVAKGDSLWKIAWMYGVSVDELTAFNKMKKDAVLKVGASVRIPPGGRYVSLSKRPMPKPKVVAVKDKAPAGGGKKDGDGKEGAVARKTNYEPLPADGKYKVQKNDNLWIIARRFGLHSADIRTANSLKSDELQIGQELLLPAAAGGAAEAAPVTAQPETPAAPAAAGAGMGEVAGLPAAAVPSAAAITEIATAPGAAPAAAVPAAAPEAGVAPAAPVAPVAAANTLEHTVLQGEKLQSIADMYEVRVDDILKVNPQVKTDADLKPNMTILVPYK